MATVLRFLATGDLQCHKWRQFATTTPDGINSRLQNCLRVFDVLRREAKTRGIDKVLINGDIFESVDYIDVEVYDAVYRCVEKFNSDGIEVVANLGNHDIPICSSDRMVHSLRPFHKVAQVVEKVQKIWRYLTIVPYNDSPERFIELLRDIRPRHQPSCLVLHAGIHGARTGPQNRVIRSRIKLRDLHPRRFGLILLSDFHKTQFLRSNVLYMGSPLQHSFGENHKPRLWDVSLLGEAPWFKLRRVYTNFPRFRKVVLDSSRYRALLETAEAKNCGLTNNYVRVIIPAKDGVRDEDVEKLAKVAGFQFQIERLPEEESAGSLDVAYEDPIRVIGRYVHSHLRNKHAQKRLIQLGRKLYGGL